MKGKFFKKNFRKLALSLAGLLFAGTAAGGVLSLTSTTASANSEPIEVLYSGSDFVATENATYADDAGKSGVKLTTVKSGDDAEGSTFKFKNSFDGAFEMDFRVESTKKYAHTATAGWSHHLTNGKQKYLLSDYSNPYADLQKMEITFTSKTDASKYFVVNLHATAVGAGVSFATSASVYIPGDDIYGLTPTGEKHYGYGLNNGAINYPGYGGTQVYGANSLAGYQTLLTAIRGTSFANFTAKRSGDGTEMPTTSNLVKFDPETMSVYVNAGTGGNTYSALNTSANQLVRELTNNTGFTWEKPGDSKIDELPMGSLNASDFAGGYTVSVEYASVTANDFTGEGGASYFGGGTQYPAIIDPAYDRYPSATIYSVNGQAVSARSTTSTATQSSTIEFDSNVVTVTEDKLNSIDNKRGLNIRSVASGAAAEGSGFAFANVMNGNFEMDFRVTSAQKYAHPATASGGWPPYVADGLYKWAYSDYANPYADVREMVFTFTSATDPSKYFDVKFLGSAADQGFATAATVYIPGDEMWVQAGADTSVKITGYGLNGGTFNFLGAKEWGAGGKSDYQKIATKIPATSFSNFTTLDSNHNQEAPTTSNLVKFDPETMSVYVNAGTVYSGINKTANVLVRDLVNNTGYTSTNGILAGSLSASDFAGGYTVSVKYTRMTANDFTGEGGADLFGGATQYPTVIETPYDRYADLTIYSVNGQNLTYIESGNASSGIGDTVAPVIWANTSDMFPGEEIDVTPNYFDVLDGNAIGVYGTVSYSTNNADWYEIELVDGKYLFTPTTTGTYFFKYEGFGDNQGFNANNITVERECSIGFKMDLGASIRAASDNTSGIRFTGRISAKGYEWLASKGDVTYTFAVTANGETKTQNVDPSKINYDEKTNTYYMTAAIVNLAPEQYETEWTAVLTATVGEETFTATANENTRTVKFVATAIMNDEAYYNTLPTVMKNAISKFVGIPYALSYNTGFFVNEAGHVQGTATDGEYIYHSFTDRIIKQRLSDGAIVGTISDIHDYLYNYAHIGDVAYYNGYVFASVMDAAAWDDPEHNNNRECFVLVIKADELKGNLRFSATYTDENGVAQPVAKLAYVGTPIYQLAVAQGYGEYSEYTAKLGGKYGVINAIDSITVGPAFGATDGETYLTLALSTPGAFSKDNEVTLENGTVIDPNAREDNDYLVLVQYDIETVMANAVAIPEKTDKRYSEAFYEAAALGQANITEFENQYFFYYGFHDCGAQNLTYDSYLNAYIATPYGVETEVSQFPNYQFFIVDATKATEGPLVGNGEETGLIVEAKYGVEDVTGVKGYPDYWGVGVIALGDGYYYLNNSAKDDSEAADWTQIKYRSYANLYKFDAEKATAGEFPFVLVEYVAE